MTRASACWKAAILIVNFTMTALTRKAATMATWHQSQLTMIWTKRRMKDCLWISKSASHTLHRRPYLKTLPRYRDIPFLKIFSNYWSNLNVFRVKRTILIRSLIDDGQQLRRRKMSTVRNVDGWSSHQIVQIPLLMVCTPCFMILLVLLIVPKSLWWLKTTLRREGSHGCNVMNNCNRKCYQERFPLAELKAVWMLRIWWWILFTLLLSKRLPHYILIHTITAGIWGDDHPSLAH